MCDLKYGQNAAKMSPKRGPKRGPEEHPKSSKTICFPCVFAQNGPPKGGQNGAKMKPKTSQNGVRFWSNLVGEGSQR